ncbi:MAG TPA: hypothetical protein VFU97_24535 [Xanthobacteraceae bacterium]|nr:hypothetical protein [Xanthobacteraceae bacterium]
MDLAELEKTIAKLRALGVRRFRGALAGWPSEIEVDLGDLPPAAGLTPGPSEAKRKEDRIRRELAVDWAHVGGPPAHVLKEAFGEAEGEPFTEPD